MDRFLFALLPCLPSHGWQPADDRKGGIKESLGTVKSPVPLPVLPADLRFPGISCPEPDTNHDATPPNN